MSNGTVNQLWNSISLNVYTNKYISITSLNEAMVHNAPDEIQYFICIFFGSFFSVRFALGELSRRRWWWWWRVYFARVKKIFHDEINTQRTVQLVTVVFFLLLFSVVLLILLRCHEGIWCMKSYVTMIEGASLHFNWLTIRLICDKNNRRVGTQDKGEEMGQTFVSDDLLVIIIIWCWFNRCHHHGYFLGIPSLSMPSHQLAKVEVLSLSLTHTHRSVFPSFIPFHRVYFIHLESLLQNFVPLISTSRNSIKEHANDTQVRFNLHNRWQTESERSANGKFSCRLANDKRITIKTIDTNWFAIRYIYSFNSFICSRCGCHTVWMEVAWHRTVPRPTHSKRTTTTETFRVYYELRERKSQADFVWKRVTFNVRFALYKYMHMQIREWSGGEGVHCRANMTNDKSKTAHTLPFLQVIYYKNDTIVLR